MLVNVSEVVLPLFENEVSLIETPLYRMHPSWFYFYGRLFFAGMFLMLAAEESQSPAGLSGAIFFILFTAYGRFRRLHTVTSQRISTRVGIVAKNTREIEISHIRGISIRQNILERLLGIGSLEMTSAAEGGTRVTFRGIKKPEKVKELIYSARGPV